MPKPCFVMFISRDAEAADLAARYPDCDFRHVSYDRLRVPHVELREGSTEPAASLLLREHAERPFAGVLNRREKFVLPAAAIAQRLGLRPIADDPEPFRDKLAMRRLISGQGFPRSARVASAAEARGLPADLFPCVLKPRYGFNSRAVRRVDTPAAAAEAFRRLQPLYGRLKCQDSRSTDFVAESFIPGAEHTYEGLIVDSAPRVEILSDKEPMTGTWFAEVGDTMPTRLDAAAAGRVRAAARDAVQRLGMRNGWVHVEVKLDAAQATVVEAAARMGGGYFGEMIESVYGLDRLRLLIELHLGRPLPALPAAQAAIAGRRVLLDGVRWVAGLPRASRALLAAPDVTLIWPQELAAVRRLLVGPPWGYKNTVCEYFVRAASPGAAAARARAIAAALRVRSIPLPAALLRPRRRRGAVLDA